MRPVKEVSAEQENFRIEPVGRHGIGMIKRDPVEPEPVGTIVVMAFRITGYEQDCDGSLMAELEKIDKDLEPTGWTPRAIGLYPGSVVAVTEDEWKAMFSVTTPSAQGGKDGE